jgi:hypothetical protein
MLVDFHCTDSKCHFSFKRVHPDNAMEPYPACPKCDRVHTVIRMDEECCATCQDE